jgi:putative FmdB family regulatory protein
MESVSAAKASLSYLNPSPGELDSRVPGRFQETPMPTYEYRCRECKNQFERVEALADHGHGRPQCPECKSRQVEQVFTAFFAKTARKA